MEKITRRDRILHLAAILFSIIFLVGGWKLTTAGSKLLGQNVNGSIEPAVKAQIVEVLSRNEIFSRYTGTVTELRTVCYAVISEGEDEGKLVLVTHVMDSAAMLTGEPFDTGDRVFIYEGENEFGEAQWFVEGPVRTGWLLGLTAAFCLLVVVFGLGKGLRTIISLILTCLAVFCVLVPAVVGGFNIYLTAIAVCFYTILVTLALVSGCTFKSLASALGCMGGVGVAGKIGRAHV